MVLFPEPDGPTWIERFTENNVEECLTEKAEMLYQREE